VPKLIFFRDVLTMKSGRREALLEIDRAMLRLRSTQTNLRVRVLMERRFGRAFNRLHSLIVDAVGELTDAGAQPSIGKVAERLGIDPSRGDRMASGAVIAGYVKRTACEDDTPAHRSAVYRQWARTAGANPQLANRRFYNRDT
jgi:hypothetical protein